MEENEKILRGLEKRWRHAAIVTCAMVMFSTGAKARRSKTSDHQDCEVLVPIRQRLGAVYIQLAQEALLRVLCFSACLRSRVCRSRSGG